MKRQGLTFRDSDSLNPQVIICIVDNQPEIDGTNKKRIHTSHLYQAMH